MKITVRSFANIRDAIGSRVVELDLHEKATAWDVLQELVRRYPTLSQILFKDSKLSPSVKIALNSENIEVSEIEQIVLSDGHQLVLIPPTGGG